MVGGVLCSTIGLREADYASDPMALGGAERLGVLPREVKPSPARHLDGPFAGIYGPAWDDIGVEWGLWEAC